jgi:pilus assembly protein CpaE
VLRSERLADAVDTYGRIPIDLLVFPLDEVDDPSLAAIDRTVWRNHDLRVIATGPAADPRLMLRAMRSGIQEFLVRPITEAECVSAMERLHRRAENGDARGDVYAVYSAKGGVGVSTVAVNLACALTTIHPTSRVAIADMEVPGGDASILLDIRPKYTISDIARKIDRLDVELLNSVMTPAADGMWMLAGPEGSEDDALISAKAATATITQLQSVFDYTLLDCEHRLNDRTLAALDTSDRILLLTELQVPAMRSTQRTLGVFRRLGYPEGKIAIVVNRYRSRDVVSLEEATEVFKEEVFFCLPNDYKTVSEASTSGIPVEHKDPSSAVSLAFRQLAQRIAGGTLPFAAASAASSAQGSGRRSRLRELFARKRN